jgi:hypothetical protein
MMKAVCVLRFFMLFRVFVNLEPIGVKIEADGPGGTREIRTGLEKGALVVLKPAFGLKEETYVQIIKK